MKKSLLSLVVLVSMLFSFQGFSQTPGTLTFSDSLGDLYSSQPINVLNNSDTLKVSDVNSGDTLFYFEFIDQNDETFKYYGIIENIDTVTDMKIDLKLHLETTASFNQDAVDINGVDITGTKIQETYPMERHFVKDTSIAPNTKLNFDTLNIGEDNKVDFKFSFKFTTTTTTGIEDNFFVEKETFKVYPNPCENQLNIEADGLKRVFDTSGRLILETYENTVNMSDLSPGMYVVMLENGARAKFVKE